MAAPNSIKAQIDHAKYIIRQQMARIAELEAEVERLRTAASAHDVLKSIYSDSNQPTGHRLKAAGLALGHESPPLKPVQPALDSVGEEVEDLATLVEKRRARQNLLCPESVADLPPIEVLPIADGRHRNGNGSGNST